MANQKKQSHASLAAQEGLQALDEQDLEMVTGGTGTDTEFEAYMKDKEKKGLSDNFVARSVFPEQTEPLLTPSEKETRLAYDHQPGISSKGSYRPPKLP
jgi:hypothetical protein